MTYPYAETGQRILEKRKELGYTREALAERADLSVQFLADIEKGKKNMTVTTLRKISSALGVSTDYIVNGSSELNDSQRAEIIDIFTMLPPNRRPYALNLLRLFAEAVNN